MCGSMADIQSPTAEIRRGKKRRKEQMTGWKLHRAAINNYWLVWSKSWQPLFCFPCPLFSTLVQVQEHIVPKLCRLLSTTFKHDITRLKCQDEDAARVLTFQQRDIIFECFMKKPAKSVLLYDQMLKLENFDAKKVTFSYFIYKRHRVLLWLLGDATKHHLLVNDICSSRRNDFCIYIY